MRDARLNWVRAARGGGPLLKALPAAVGCAVQLLPRASLHTLSKPGEMRTASRARGAGSTRFTPIENGETGWTLMDAPLPLYPLWIPKSSAGGA